ncbi:YidC/Oxa1 family membrane protein insertase [Candidatus Dojkabacteria bacterium]|jgi:YidC/Oxa1 family membrane protein insertase|nr:YidC/Oxa1 family membrane protein insertase [Candidatus Dojkabacteria bacterium]
MLATIWNTILFFPFLNILTLLYKVLGENLGLAVIVIAIIIRLALIPSSKKQMDMSKKLAEMKPKLDKIQKLYANNKKKLSEEQVKLYKESGYNPVGCFTSFIPQILVLYAIIGVINVVTKVNVNGLGLYIGNGLYPFVSNWVFPHANSAMCVVPYDANITYCITYNLKFFFFDLSRIAKDIVFKVEGIQYVVLAILVGFVQYISTKFMQIMQGQAPVASKKPHEKTPEEAQAQMMNSMNYLFPLMTIYFTIITPSVLGIYWLIQSLMMVVQYYIIDPKKFMTTLKQVFTFKFPKLNFKKK